MQVRKVKVLVGLVPVLVLSGCASTATSSGAPSTGTSIFFHFKPGDVLRYKLSGTQTSVVDGFGHAAETSANSTESADVSYSVGQVDGKGVATVMIAFATVVMNGTPQTQPSLAIKIGKDGVFAPGQDAAGQATVADQQWPILADHPVKVGDTWDKNLVVQANQVPAHNRFTRMEKVGGKEAAVVESDFSIPIELDHGFPTAVTGRVTNPLLKSQIASSHVHRSGHGAVHLTGWVDVTAHRLLRFQVKLDVSYQETVVGSAQLSGALGTSTEKVTQATDNQAF